MNEYPLCAYDNNPQLAQNRISTDRGKCQYLNSFKLMASTNTSPLYTYDFTYQNAPYYFPQMPNVSNIAGPSPGHFLPLTMALFIPATVLAVLRSATIRPTTGIAIRVTPTTIQAMEPTQAMAITVRITAVIGAIIDALSVETTGDGTVGIGL
jgi:hypothetical protein